MMTAPRPGPFRHLRALLRALALACCLSSLCAPVWSVSVAGPARRPAKAPVRSLPAVPAEDQGLADWSLQPFSDLASHGVLWHRGQGLMAWRLCSARAFGSLAAAPHGAKLLFDLTFDVQVEGEASPRFAALSATVESWPRWAVERAEDRGLQAEAITVFSGQDVVVAAVDLRNGGNRPLLLRPRLHLRRDGNGLRGSAQLSARYPALWLALDRSQAVGRRLVENAGIWMGAEAWTADLAGATMTARQSQDLGDQGLELTLSWQAPETLAPGQTLRVPLLLAWGTDMDSVQKTAENQWVQSALPMGKAYAAARDRWRVTEAHLPKVAEHARLLKRAALNLTLSEYGPQAALSAAQFSADKGLRDAFFSVDTPLAALGWAELDVDKAEAALLDLAGFSAAAPAAVPPYTGEEKLPWDAAGLPLNAWAAWELYHRDPKPARAAQFLAGFGTRLRNECAWWPPNRDGDGNGLYAFAREEEKPAYMLRQDALAAGSNPTAGATMLESWSLALSSLVAWQMQAAAALAQAAGNQGESEQLMQVARHSQDAIHAQAWDVSRSAYVQGLDGMWPLLLGLESDEGRAKAELDGWIPSLSVPDKEIWMEGDVWEPWRVYLVARTLSLYGYFDQSRKISEDFLSKTEKIGSFPAEIHQDGTYDPGSSAATAAAVMEFLLERQEQEVFLTQNTGEFTARWIQFRSLDGSFYMKRSILPDRKEKYAEIKVETPLHGKIMHENAFIISCPESLAVQIQSDRGINISPIAKPDQLIFKDAHRVELLIPARKAILVRFMADAKQN
jgi:hypothetical protein